MRLNLKNASQLREKVLKDSFDSKIFLRPCWTLLNYLPMYEHSPFIELKEAQEQSMRLINPPSSPHLIY